jgi:hypothetical protein
MPFAICGRVYFMFILVCSEALGYPSYPLLLLPLMLLLCLLPFLFQFFVCLRLICIDYMLFQSLVETLGHWGAIMGGSTARSESERRKGRNQGMCIFCF